MAGTYLKLREIVEHKNYSLQKTAGNIKYFTWGDDNKYPYFIEYLRLANSLHGGIINGKVLRILGKEQRFNRDISNGLMPQNLRELISLCVSDFETYNCFAVLVKEVAGNVYYKYLSAKGIRYSTCGKYILYSENWAKRSDVKVYANYFTNKEENIDKVAVFGFGVGTTMIDDETKEVKESYYPSPIYASGINSIRTGIEIINFHYSEIINGFKGGTVISLNNGYISDDYERRNVEASIKEAATNKNKQGGIVVLYADGKEREPSISSLNGNNLDTRYMLLKEAVTEDILTAHGVVSPLLVGVQVAGKLGGATELEKANEIFNANYIMPRRSQVVDFFKQIGLQVEFIDEAKTPVNKAFSDDEKELENRIIAEFEKCGKKLNGEILQQKSIDELKKNQAFSMDLTETQLNILNLIGNKEKISAIAESLNLSVTELLSEINHLKKLGLITENFELSKKGKNLANTAKTVVRVYYRYMVRDGLGEPIKPTTRAFCKRLIELNKIYTREEIDAISKKVGRDVWYYRGGFYNNGKVITPHCRHTWYQIFVKEEI